MPVGYDSPITDLGLTTQAPKALAEAGITTVAQLLAAGRNRIEQLRGMGNARLHDIDDAIARHRLTWHARAVHHGGQPGGPVCDDCDTHHRELVQARALELAGRLA